MGDHEPRCESRRIWEKGNSREMELEYIRLDSPTHECVVNCCFLIHEVQVVTNMGLMHPMRDLWKVRQASLDHVG